MSVLKYSEAAAILIFTSFFDLKILEIPFRCQVFLKFLSQKQSQILKSRDAWKYFNTLNLMFRKQSLFFLRVFFFLFFTTLIHAETLEEMFLFAKSFDARYAASRAEYEAASFQFIQARGKLFPSLNTSANLSRNNQIITYDDPRFLQSERVYNTYGWSAQIVQPVFRLEEWASMSASRRMKEQAFHQLRQAEADLALRLAEAYYDFLLAKENLEFLEVQKEVLHQQLIVSQGRQKVGANSMIEPLQIKARYAAATAATLESRWELENKRRVLQSIAGPNILDPEPVSELAIEKSWGDLDDWIWQSSKNPQIVAASMGLEVAKQGELRSHSNFWPTVDIVGNYEDSRLGPNASLSVETRNKNASAGLRFAWALFSGGGTVAAFKAAQKQREKAESELVAVEQQVKIQIAEAYSGIHFGLEQIEALHQSVSASAEVLRAMEEGKKVGARTQSQVLEAKQQWMEAKLNQNRALYKLLLNQMKLRLAVG